MDPSADQDQGSSDSLVSSVLPTSGQTFSVPLPSVTVTTDASLVGWGGLCQGSVISGDWNHLDALLHFYA